MQDSYEDEIKRYNLVDFMYLCRTIDEFKALREKDQEKNQQYWQEREHKFNDIIVSLLT